MKWSIAEFGTTRMNCLIGCTVAIGALSGIFLLTKHTKLLSKIIERKSKNKSDNRCNICFDELELNDDKRCIICCNCGKAVCRGQQCSTWLPNQAGWECHLCNLSNESRSRASEWLQRQPFEQFLRPMNSRSEIFFPVKDKNEGSHISGYDAHSETTSSIGFEQKDKIREHVEQVLADILGGSLDEVTIGQLYRSRDYLPLSGTQSDVSHAKLRPLIERIIEDALHLPGLINNGRVPGQLNERLPYFDPKKYEDLLATAVLNKIIDSVNYEKKINNSEKSLASDLDKNHNSIAARQEPTRSSTSSNEPHSDSSFTDTNNITTGGYFSPSDSCPKLFDKLNRNNEQDGELQLSDYLARHEVPLPDFSVSSDSTNDDLISDGTSDGLERSWSNNWLFKKRKNGSDSPAPIGMLVPAPKEDVRALIGDRPMDEISDLSEACSELDETEFDLNDIDEPPNNRVHNKHLIGGKSTIGIFDELLEETSLISTSSLPDNEPMYTDTRNDFVLGSDGLCDMEQPKIDLLSGKIPVNHEAINSIVSTGILQRGLPIENIEDIQLDSLEESILEPPSEFVDIPQNQSIADNNNIMNQTNVDNDIGGSNDPVSPSESNGGSIAEREHKKWYNAVEMPNNPYSPEALIRRLSDGPEKPMDIPTISPVLEKSNENDEIGSTKSIVNLEREETDYTRYSRDYYINNAKPVHGSRKNVFKRMEATCHPSVDSEREPSTTSLELSTCGDKRTDNLGDIFLAKPVRVEENDPILSKAATKLYHLGTPERDIALLPSDESGNIIKQSLPSPDQNSSPNADSLTTSEDSDTIRIYDLNKQETRIIKDESVTTPPNTPKRPTALSFSPKAPAPRIGTPTSLKFLQPKRKRFDPTLIMGDNPDGSFSFDEPVESTTSEIPKSTSEVIEKEVVPTLPSVKALARAYLSLASSKTTTNNLSKSKSASWQTLTTKDETQVQPAERREEQSIEGPSSDSYSPPYEQRFCPISTSILIENPKPNGQYDPSEKTIPEVESTTTVQRPISPVVKPGQLRNSIAFFENLNNK